MDIALLNLANVLHRSQHSADALVPLQVAVSLAPDVNVLHYTLGNVYAVSHCVCSCVCMCLCEYTYIIMCACVFVWVRCGCGLHVYMCT